MQVDELLDVTVTSRDAEAISVLRGQAALIFEATKLRNGPEAYELTVQTALGDNDFATTLDHIAIDSNGNGAYDPRVDQILTSPQTSPVLGADAGTRAPKLTRPKYIFTSPHLQQTKKFVANADHYLVIRIVVLAVQPDQPRLFAKFARV